MLEDFLRKLLAKLERSETVCSSLFSDQKKGRVQDVGRRQYDALNAIRAAQQMIRDELLEPKVPREGFSREMKDVGYKKDLVEQHESYGQLSVTRPTGTVRLVGTMMDSLPNFVKLTVHRSQRMIDQDLHTEMFFQKGPPVLEIWLSTYQWAEAISSMNGVAIPCTIKNVQGVQMDLVPDEVRTPLEQIVEQTQEQARQRLDQSEEDYLGALAALSEHIDTLNLSKKKTGEIQKHIKALRDFVEVPQKKAKWASQRVSEDAEKAVSQAKVEMGAALTSLLQSAGQGALAEKLGMTAADIAPRLGPHKDE